MKKLIRELVVNSGFALSGNEARRLIMQGSVEVNKRRIEDPDELIDVIEALELRVGKRSCKISYPA